MNIAFVACITFFLSCPIDGLRISKNTDDKLACGQMGGRFFKLHKVGSTTAGIVLESYADRHRLKLCSRECPSNPSEFFNGCQMSITHEASEVMANHFGMDAFFNATKGISLTSTVVRDPKARILSRYFYDLAKIGLSQSKVGWPAFRKWSENNLRSEGKHYLRLLTGSSLHNVESDPQQYLDQSIKNLHRFDVVGITERMPEFIALLASSYGCDAEIHKWVYHSEKRVLGHPKFEEIPEDLQEMIRRATEHDDAIWKEATKLSLLQEKQIPNFASLVDYIKGNSDTQACEGETSKGRRSKVFDGLDCYEFEEDPHEEIANFNLNDRR